MEVERERERERERDSSGAMFQKSLQDLVKGIRSHRNNSTAYISSSIVEIKKELKSPNAGVKTLALQKATYLQMQGYDVSWACFHIVEGMSLPVFKHRRAAHVSASQIFRQDTDVILLCTNLLQKQLMGKNYYVSGMALNTLSNIATRELARDLLENVANLMTSTRPYVRKKAIIALFKLFVQYPQGLPLAFDRLWAKLQDAELAVVSCAVNVFCELSRKKPSNYLKLAPLLFNLLTTTSNNWMLIKVVKLMSSLIPVEPRLARKMLQPLSNIIETTPAKSLLYECASCVAVALQHSCKSDGTQPKIVPALVQLCSSKLREFVESRDQNLKYLGLVGFVDLMKSHPGVIAGHKDIILQCLVDDDTNVRLRALELLSGMVTRRNLVDIVQKLLEHAYSAEGSYRDVIIEKIVYVCTRDKYKFLTDFTWLISVFVELAHIPGSPQAPLIASTLMDVVGRVPSVRGFACHSMSALIVEGRLAMRAADEAGLLASHDDGEMKAGGLLMDHVLSAAAWIACEYAHLQQEGLEIVWEEYEEDAVGAQRPSLIAPEEIGHALLIPQSLRLPAKVQSVFVHNAMKLLWRVADGGGDLSRVVEFANSIATLLRPFARSEYIEVQARAVAALSLLCSLDIGILPLEDNDEGAGHIIAAENGSESDDETNNVFLQEKPSEVQVGSLIDFGSEEIAGEEKSAPGAQSAPDLFDPLASNAPSIADTTAAPDVMSVSKDDECDVSKVSEIRSALSQLFAGELRPANAKAQANVPIPEGLDLDKVLFDENKKLFDDDDESGMPMTSVLSVTFDEFVPCHAASFPQDEEEYGGSVLDDIASPPKRTSKETRASARRAAAARASDPFYLTPDRTMDTPEPAAFKADIDVDNDLDDDVPMVRLDDGVLGKLSVSSSSASKRRRPKRRPQKIEILDDAAMPEGSPPSSAAAHSKRKSSSRRSKRTNSEDVTLEDIDLGALAAEKEKPSKKRSHRSEKSSKKKKGKQRKHEKEAGESRVSSSQKDKKKKKKKKKKTPSSSKG